MNEDKKRATFFKVTLTVNKYSTDAPACQTSNKPLTD